MNTQEKSLKLAELMDMPKPDEKGIMRLSEYTFSIWEPYGRDVIGLSQFAAILLKFPEVMRRYNAESGHMKWSTCECLKVKPTPSNPGGAGGFDIKDFDLGVPTQANILDEILRMKGVEI